MQIKGYDNWKLESPCEYETETALEDCDNCKQSFDTNCLELVGKLLCCQECALDVKDLQAQVESLFEPVWKYKSLSLKKKLRKDSIANFLPKEQTLRWLMGHVKKFFSIKGQRIRITELNAEQCHYAIQLLEGLYFSNHKLIEFKDKLELQKNKQDVKNSDKIPQPA